jgi:hypothetical protein
MKAASSVLLVLAVPPLAWVTASADEPRKPPAFTQVTVPGIVAAYRYNDARVDEYLADKTIDVTGTVNDVFRMKTSSKEDKTGMRYVLELSAVPNTDLPRLQCFFEETARKALAQLEPGQPVKVRGKCQGMQPLAVKAPGPDAEPSLPPPRPVSGIVLTDCELVPLPPAPKTGKTTEKKQQ